MNIATKDEEFKALLKYHKLIQCEKYERYSMNMDVYCQRCGKEHWESAKSLVLAVEKGKNICKCNDKFLCRYCGKYRTKLRRNGLCRTCYGKITKKSKTKEKRLKKAHIAAEAQNMTLIGIDNSPVQYHYKCKEGHTFSQGAYIKIKCPECSKTRWANKKYTFKEVVEYCKKKNLTVLSDEYLPRQHMEFKCDICDYSWLAVFANLLQYVHNCPACASKYLNKEEDFRLLAQQRGWSVVSLPEPITIDSKIELKCDDCGHLFDTRARAMKRSKYSTCPNCANMSDSERKDVNGCIYMATSTITGKSYIGQTIQSIALRKNSHRRDSINKDQPAYRSHFQRAIRKHGFDTFDWTILHANVDWKDLDRIETEEIEKYDTFRNGYNSCTGGGKAGQTAAIARRHYHSVKKQRKIKNRELRAEAKKNRELVRIRGDVFKSLRRLMKKLLRIGEHDVLKATEKKRRKESGKVKYAGDVPDSSRYRGVVLEKRSNSVKWKANIKHHGKKIHIGVFDDEIDAAKAYDAKAEELRVTKGRKAKFNFPRER